MYLNKIDGMIFLIEGFLPFFNNNNNNKKSSISQDLTLFVNVLNLRRMYHRGAIGFHLRDLRLAGTCTVRGGWKQSFNPVLFVPVCVFMRTGMCASYMIIFCPFDQIVKAFKWANNASAQEKCHVASFIRIITICGVHNANAITRIKIQ